MRIRNSVFDSRSEQEIFRELDSRLNPKLRLMTQMGLRSLIHLDDAAVARLKPRHHRYFRQATVDFTFIYPDGRPLLSIEFDGIGGGYSRGRTYVGHRKTPDQHRDWKMRFKLAAAERVGHPLFVISGDEIEHLDTDSSLMLFDGIVGQIFSRWEERRIAEELLGDDAELVTTMSPGAAQEHAQDLVLQAGVIADLEFDHLAIAVAQEQQRCHEQFGFGFGGYKLAWLYDPPIPTTVGAMTPDLLRLRIAGMRAADRVGSRVGVAIGNGRYIDATAWMRNIGQSHGLTPELVAEQVAEYLAIRRAIRLAEAGQLVEHSAPAPWPQQRRAA